MNVAEVAEADAFIAGAELWILKNDTKNKWWQEIDFRSGFLLSHCLYRHRQPTSTKLTEILQLTALPHSEFIQDTDLLLIGSSDHFLNKWILLWNTEVTPVTELLEKISTTLKLKSVRCFTDSDILLKQLEASPKTSLADISFIKNT